jgi:phosphoenolpyruvate carboxylase
MSDRIRERYDDATDKLVEAAREACTYLPPRRAEKLRKALANYDKSFSALIKSG